MQGGQQSGDTLYENGIGWGLMLMIFAVLIWIFWFFFDHEIRDMVRWIRYSEMWLVSWFIDPDYIINYKGKEIPFQTGFERTPQYEKGKMNYDHLSMFSAFAMQPLKVPIMSILGAGALWCIFMGPGTNNRKRMGLEQLIEHQSKMFPVITPFVRFNPATQPPRPPGAPVPAELPSFAEALGPEEWLAYNNINPKDGKINAPETVEMIAKAFTAQLGKPWRGANNLDPYKQILLAAFCLKASRKRVDADEMIGRVAKCWSSKEGLKLSRDSKLLKDARKILGDKNLSAGTLAQANRHAYETTALMRALQYAREEGGVMAPAHFVWLRAYDRNLWYPLNNMGRQSFHTEALGAMAHFKAERLTQRPIPVPKIDGALETIIEYMSSRRARPIPQLDYSNSKKRGIKEAV